MKPKVIVLVGPPLSGKDSHIKKNDYDTYEVISRDEILMSLHPNDNYTEAFNKVNQKLVDKILNHKIEKAITNNENVIINMTNLTKKSRNKHLTKFPKKDYERVAVILPKLTDEEYEYRNNKRAQEENKYIPLDVIRTMINRWEEVTEDEGFDKIIKL